MALFPLYGLAPEKKLLICESDTYIGAHRFLQQSWMGNRQPYIKLPDFQSINTLSFIHTIGGYNLRQLDKLLNRLSIKIEMVCCHG